MFRLLLVVSLLMAGLTTTASAREVRFASYDGAVVHYPSDVTEGVHPLVVMLHGWYAVCSDRRPDATYDDKHKWPCQPGVPEIPSNRGYDYLAQELAARGMIVVSVNANPINGGVYRPDEFTARADLVNQHLGIWQRLTTTGEGPLSSSFKGHVDMTNVGVMGHSKGGRGVAQQSSDDAHDKWPAGVRVKAVVALEPIPSGGERVSQIPFLTVIGGCDRVSNDAAEQYFDNAAERNVVPVHQMTVRGANHSFFNTVWSPSSGEVDAEDDAEHTTPGNCRNPATGADEKQLTEEEQRQIGVQFLTAFFQSYLVGGTFNPSDPRVDLVTDLP